MDCLCCICQEVLEDPKETLTCQHAFCHTCISHWLQEHQSCPTCRCPLSLNDLVTLHRVWREKLDHLQIRCHNYSDGCEAIVELEKLDYHLNACPYVHVTCPHSPCQEVVVRSMLSAHLKICSYRLVPCQTCQLSVPAVSLEEHQCIPALREDMERKMDTLKREWTDVIRSMRREQRKMEERILIQENEIAGLRNALSVLLHQNKLLPHLPHMTMTGCAMGMPVTTRVGHINSSAVARNAGNDRHCRRSSVHSSQQHDVVNQRRTTEPTNITLPRLAPLHTRMTLNRSPGYHSGMLYQLDKSGQESCTFIDVFFFAGDERNRRSRPQGFQSDSEASDNQLM